MIRMNGLVALLLLGAAGCTGSVDPTRFYVLAPTDSAADAAARSASERDLRIGIRSVELPRYLERPQIVTRASATRLEVADFHQWGAPLRQAVPMILVADRDGVVQASFVGPPGATDLWAAVAEVRDPGAGRGPGPGRSGS